MGMIIVLKQYECLPRWNVARNMASHFKIGSLMRANDGGIDLNMHWYKYGMYDSMSM